jgi:protein-tyrosine phosphatase
MPTVLDWNPSADPAALAGAARDSLAGGAAVVLPGDVGYVVLVNPADPRAAAALDTLGSILNHPPTVLAYGPEDAEGLGLAVPEAARRLMVRAWAGPLTVALTADGLAPPPAWQPGVAGKVASGGLVRFRCPDHPLFDALIPTLGFPVLAADTFANAWVTAESIAANLGDAVGLMVNAGDLPAAERPTVVRADAGGWGVVESGVFPEAEIAKLTARIVLFVCTGNTCRSPMAEGLAKAALAERLGCPAADLPARGFWVLSAGVATYAGAGAAAEAAEVARELGADLSAHRSRPVNPQLLAAADDVIAMTRGHAEAMAVRYPDLGPPVRLLCGEAEDLDDPIGGDAAVYRACAETIRRHLDRFLPEWLGS